MNPRVMSRRTAYTLSSSFPYTRTLCPTSCLSHGLTSVRLRNISQTTRTQQTAILQPTTGKTSNNVPPSSLLSRVPTAHLFRSLLLGYCFSSPRLLKISLSFMSIIIHSKSSFLNPDKNPIVGAILRAMIYNQFCAGDNAHDVRKSIQRTKNLGYSGVILGFSREILAEEVGETTNSEVDKKAIESWKEANLETLRLIGNGDYLGLKFTGAGEGTSKALLEGSPPSEELVKAMDAICEEAQRQGSGVWVDAEQQPYQGNVNTWAMSFMKRWNRNGQVVVFNTIQAYLKSSREYVQTHLKAAQAEGWTCAIKLVRGAYIQSDIRERIWDTKSQTDDNYNSIVHDLLTKSFGAVTKDKFPDVRLFIAGHNKESVRLATKLVADLVDRGENVGPVQYGQLQGMADEVSCELLRTKESMQSDTLPEQEKDKSYRATPQPYKCLIWGSVNDCLHFLMRRAVENATAAERLQDGLVEMRSELKKRLLFR